MTKYFIGICQRNGVLFAEFGPPEFTDPSVVSLATQRYSLQTMEHRVKNFREQDQSSEKLQENEKGLHMLRAAHKRLECRENSIDDFPLPTDCSEMKEKVRAEFGNVQVVELLGALAENHFTGKNGTFLAPEEYTPSEHAKAADLFELSRDLMEPPSIGSRPLPPKRERSARLIT